MTQFEQMAPTYVGVFRSIFVHDVDDSVVGREVTEDNPAVAIVVSDVRTPDDPPRHYYVEVPRVTAPGQYVWGYLLRAVGRSVEDIIEGADETTGANTVLHDSLEKINAQLAGSKVTVVSTKTGQLVMIRPLTFEASQAPESATEPVEVDAASPSIRVAVAQVGVIQPTAIAPAYIVVALENGYQIAIDVPKEGQASRLWSLIEPAVDVLEEHVSKAWTLSANTTPQWTNALLDKAVERMNALIARSPMENSVQCAPSGEPMRQRFAYDLLRSAFQEPSTMVAVVLGRLPKENVTTAWLALSAATHGRMFRWQPSRSEATDTGAIVCIQKQNGKDVLYRPSSLVSVRRLLNQYCKFIKLGKSGGVTLHQPPDDLVSDVLAGPTFDAVEFLPPLDLFTRTPLMAPNGDVLDTPGYNAQARIWYAPAAGFSMPPVSRSPTEHEVHDAVATIYDIIQDFPFVSDAGGAAATFAAILDQFARPLIKGPRMIYAIDAPGLGQGTGKTKLAQTIAAIACGETAIDLWKDDEDELGKTIFAHARSGSQVVVFDNVEGQIKSPNLAAVATSDTIRWRPLYSNEVEEVPNCATWIITCNGVTFNKDIARRTAVIQISAQSRTKGESTAHDKMDYKYDLPNAAIALRPKLVHACLTILSNWVAKGRPPHPGLKVGSYEAWARVLGGATFAAGVYGLYDAISTSLRRDADTTEFELFVRQWAETFGGADLHNFQLVNMCRRAGIMETYCRGDQTWAPRRLSTQVAKLAGSVIAGYKIYETTPSRDGRKRWQLRTRTGEVMPPRIWSDDLNQPVEASTKRARYAGPERSASDDV